MKLEIIRVADAGDLTKERVVMRANDTVDVGEHLLLRARANAEGSVFAGVVQLAYWFPSFDLKKNDFVVLYSRKGTPKQKEGANGRVTRFYYMGQEEPLYDSDKCVPVLVEVADFESHIIAWPSPEDTDEA